MPGRDTRERGLWLEVAQRLTARALAREVRAVDARSLEAIGAPETDEDGVEEVARETVWLRVSPRVRARWGRARLLARQVAGEALSQAAVAEVIAAEVMSAIGVDGGSGPLELSISVGVGRESPEGASRRTGRFRGDSRQKLVCGGGFGRFHGATPRSDASCPGSCNSTRLGSAGSPNASRLAVTGMMPRRPWANDPHLKYQQRALADHG